MAQTGVEPSPLRASRGLEIALTGGEVGSPTGFGVGQELGVVAGSARRRRRLSGCCRSRARCRRPGTRAATSRVRSAWAMVGSTAVGLRGWVSDRRPAPAAPAADHRRGQGPERPEELTVCHAATRCSQASSSRRSCRLRPAWWQRRKQGRRAALAAGRDVADGRTLARLSRRLASRLPPRREDRRTRARKSHLRVRIAPRGRARATSAQRQLYLCTALPQRFCYPQRVVAS